MARGGRAVAHLDAVSPGGHDDAAQQIVRQMYALDATVHARIPAPIKHLAHDEQSVSLRLRLDDEMRRLVGKDARRTIRRERAARQFRQVPRRIFDERAAARIEQHIFALLAAYAPERLFAINADGFAHEPRTRQRTQVLPDPHAVAIIRETPARRIETCGLRRAAQVR